MRRLGLLAAALLLTLAVAPFLGRSDDVVSVAAGSGGGGSGAGAVDDTEVEGTAASTAVRVRELMGQTTSAFVDATTSTTSVDAEGEAGAPTSDAGRVDIAADATTSTTADRSSEATTTTTTAAPAPSATSSTSPPTTQAPTTTTSPPTTQAPTTTTSPPTTQAPTTTTEPPPESDPDGGEDRRDGSYEYGDPRGTQVWYDLADCEAGGNWSIDNGNGYYGGLQFSLGSWEAVGGSGYPHEHPASTQIDMGRRLQERQGWGAWPHCSRKLGLR